MKKILNKLFPKKFKPYWNKNKNSDKFDDTLKFITENFVNSNSYKFVSNQWHLLNINDFESIKKNGLNKYGSEISTHYFTFLDYSDEHIRNLFKSIKNINNISYQADILKKQSNLDNKTSLTYNLLCLILYENLKLSKCFGHLSKLSDDTYCNYDHPFINIDNYKITSDKIISLFDFENIDNFYKLNDQNKILEIGAGSGRLSECLLSINQNFNYTICDIPPSIYIAYQRLKLRFPKKKIKLLINIDEANQLINEINKNDISFIFPHQVKIIKEFYFDLTIAVDCLHEMDKDTLNYYFNSLNHSTKNFYFSIWKKTKNWGSGNFFKKTENLDFDNGDYNIPNNWEKKFQENLKFPSNQIGLGFKIK
jgi:putative sugar O-methyltransferase